jgi:hypothetical protein
MARQSATVEGLGRLKKGDEQGYRSGLLSAQSRYVVRVNLHNSNVTLDPVFTANPRIAHQNLGFREFAVGCCGAIDGKLRTKLG